MKPKQLVILSGKGGTGKTSVAAALAHLAHTGEPSVRAVLADADVDAANLALAFQADCLERNEFVGGSVAKIESLRCEGCGSCEAVCRFEAVIPPNGSASSAYRIDPIACDGCAACVYQCPTQAIRMEPQIVGEWFRSSSRFGMLFHAELRPAQENSGKLVTLVKQQARLYALDHQAELILIDGPPGIGCPVISAASGADLALIIAEPSAAGIHDMERVLDLAAHFRLPARVSINKWDIHPQGTEVIRRYCEQNQVPLAGFDIPFDPAVPRAMVQAQPVTAFEPDSPASQAIRGLWSRIVEALQQIPEAG